MGQRVVEQQHTAVGAVVPHTVESARGKLGEAAREGLLPLGEYAHAEMGRLRDDGGHVRRAIDAGQHERRIQAHGAECARGHPVVAVAVSGSEHGDAGREASEHRTELVGVYCHVGCDAAGARKSRDKYESRRTRLAGTKSPVTPASRSARSLWEDIARTARLTIGGQATPRATSRSTRHLPENSRARAWSYSRSGASGSRAESATAMAPAASSPPRSAA